ncbi:MAG TPA: hypothetical protein VF284_12805, partial [Rhodanobacteraceae bacterium]
LDERTLTALQELTRGQFPDRVHHGAWFHFYRFLADPDVDHVGWSIGNLGPAPERAISAKILTAAELQDLERALLSVRSGIGTPGLRLSAARHVELMRTYGLRRAESAYLRGVDFQEDLCRVQAYAQHTLKTAWADRVLPMALAEPAMAGWVGAARGQEKLIDSDDRTTTHPDNFFDDLSRLVKRITGDASMASHHLRHTLINRWVLTLLRDAVALDACADDFPWLPDLLLGTHEVTGLMGSEGNAGQGLRAVAAMVGHSHPTTTLRHYVHVMGLVLHGALEKADSLDIARSFERRMGGKSTLYRWNQELRARYASIIDEAVRRRRCNRALRDRLEQRYPAAHIDRDETARKIATTVVAPIAIDAAGPAIDFDAIERIDQVLRYGLGTLDPILRQRYVDGLQALSCLRSGKRGERYRVRHVAHEVRVHPQGPVWLPRALPVGTEVHAAQVLCEWLETLRVRRPEEFLWLLRKWRGASSRERGRMRLDTPDEVKRARSLTDPERVRIVIQYAVVAKDRRTAKVKRVPRLRIKCLDTRGKVLVRDTIATRWVLSYVAAYNG